MEHTHLISVCVFCLLCATHIHCSEYSLHTSKAKVKSKGEDSNWNLYPLKKADKEADDKSEERKNFLEVSTISYENAFHVSGKNKKFLKNIQRSAKSESVESFSSKNTNTNRHSDKFTLLDTNLRTYNKLISVNSDFNVRNRRNTKNVVPVLDEQVYIDLLFKKYKNSDNKIDLNGFKKLLKNLHLIQFVNSEHISDDNSELESQTAQDDINVDSKGNKSFLSNCYPAEKLLQITSSENLAATSPKNVLSSERRKLDSKNSENQSHYPNVESNLYLTEEGFVKLCPFLLYHIAEPNVCHTDDHHHHNDSLSEDDHLVWVYASVSVVVISLCGLMSVCVIPIMGNAFYQQLLQFLVALAVGTLCGDALLHLLPHALIPHLDNEHDEENDHDQDRSHNHNATMWKCLAVLLGIVFFFLTEKVLALWSEWRKKSQRNNNVQGHSHVQILNGNNQSDSIGEKLCKHKYSSYPYCYPDIKSNKDGHEHSKTRLNESQKGNHHEGNSNANQDCANKWYKDLQDSGESQRLTQPIENEIKNDDDSKENTENEIVPEKDLKTKESEIECDRKDGEYTVIIREHEVAHHGHSHAHGHVHSPPETLSSVAWMVVLGDGLHNFTDGMAIGAAFSNNIAGGFSTAVAVFCHELPHELGDFAVLLKAGMSAKQAIFYNLMSSILCFIGMCLGIFVGDNPESTSWVFAVSAGMFLYIGLVDMFPELTSSHSAVESSFCQCSLQGLGLISGVSIMLIIAYYEDNLLNLFK